MDNEEGILANAERRYGAVTVVRKSELYHPDAVAVKQADVTVTYRFGSAGMVVEWSCVWAVTGAKVKRSYPAMFPVNGDTFTVGP
ncbi:hypothetical protein PV768_04445 [Pseudarthrobacter sp. CC4]|uniref:hypothetical protein n=1 Tax=Pseudarthrobacter sp. CC4 TaxID=3029190 RepID=UPI003B8D2C6F